MSTATETTKKTRQHAEEVPFEAFTGDIPFKPLTATGRTRVRSEYQLSMDKLVEESYDLKKPKGLMVARDEKAIADLILRIRNSGNHLKVGIRFGETRYTQDNRALVSFVAVERIAKPRKAKSE